MSMKMHIVLEGLPERVQEAADRLDRAFPGVMTWRSFAELGRDHAVRLEGNAVEQDRGLPRSPIWQTGRPLPTKQEAQFCREVVPQHRPSCVSRVKAMPP